MRYPASEKLEIIRLVERSHLPVRRTLDKLGIPSTTFYRWYDRYQAFGEAGLEDRTSGPSRVWNEHRQAVRQNRCGPPPFFLRANDLPHHRQRVRCDGVLWRSGR